jgi:hypothetical protein
VAIVINDFEVVVEPQAAAAPARDSQPPRDRETPALRARDVADLRAREACVLARVTAH